MSILDIVFPRNRYKKYTKLLSKVNKLESEFSLKTNEEIKLETSALRELYKTEGFSEKLITRACANARECSKRILQQRHFDVQIIGALILHDGCVAEMKTGEGKSLVATLAGYINSLSGNTVHIVTVNDYLVKRDAIINFKPLFEGLDVSVGCVTEKLEKEQKRIEYQKDIVYVTNNELGFDYLRDNMATSIDEMTITQRSLSFAIVDEADSILIDESRTPLIISGPSISNPKIYQIIDKMVKKLSANDYELDEKYKNAQLTDNGIIKMENMLKAEKIIPNDSTLHEVNHISIIHNIIQSIKANFLFHKNTDYILKDKKVVLIDEFTGRSMDDRRYSEGLHQAIEAKENVEIQNENQTYASITYQNLFRMYQKLSGMTGTAITEEQELMYIYGLKVIPVPTNRPNIRKDYNDVILINKRKKYEKILEEVQEVHKKGQPILIGTTNIQTSEEISMILKKAGLKHNVLNAKNHEKEAEIISQAGKFESITIATNMAGRGTDIKLGGDVDADIRNILHDDSVTEKEKRIEEILSQRKENKQKVIEAGGLYVIGSERHESRRIDNQLIGRSGRQGDPGCSKFFLSFEDNLLRLFGGEKMEKYLTMFGFKEEESLDHKMLNGVIKKSQKRIEGIHYDMRKNTLQYDNVLNEQRKQIYQDRIEIMTSSDIVINLKNMLQNFNQEMVNKMYINEEYKDNQQISSYFSMIYNTQIHAASGKEEMLDILNQTLETILNDKLKITESSENLSQIVKQIMLFSIDEAWREHLFAIDHIKTDIEFQAYAQKNPLHEYKHKTFELFETTIEKFIQSCVFNLSRIQKHYE